VRQVPKHRYASALYEILVGHVPSQWLTVEALAMQLRDVAVDIVLETTAFIWAAADVIRIGDCLLSGESGSAHAGHALG
jgi:hypothetical protein